MAQFERGPFARRYYYATIILVALNVLVFLVGVVAGRRSLVPLYLIPDYVMQLGAWWQVATYMFVHGGFQHILFNMIGLVVFGIPLEQRMGSTEFLLYYFLCGICAGIATLFIDLALGMGMSATVGASGALFAVMLGFASFFPDARIYILGILPVRAGVLVAVYAVIETVLQFSGFQPGVAHITHLAGLAFGALYIILRFRINPVRAFFPRR
jgi:membrane associated rhomboid family serine protease